MNWALLLSSSELILKEVFNHSKHFLICGLLASLGLIILKIFYSRRKILTLGKQIDEGIIGNYPE